MKKVSIKNKRVFKYKGLIYVVSEINEDIKGFNGCCLKRDNIKCCLINSNLSEIEKRRTLHRLIKEKHLTRR